MKAEVINLKSEIHEQMQAIGKNARAAYAVLAEASNEQKDMALVQAALALREHATGILHANEKDMAYGREKGLDAALLDRLKLDEKRIEAMAAGLETIVTLPDPVNKMLDEWARPNGLVLQRVSIPLGVIGIIYESRPGVTADAAGLCIKSGNAVILRGGSESLHSAQAIAECIHHGLESFAGLPQDAVQVMATRDRAAVAEMLTTDRHHRYHHPARRRKSLTKRVHGGKPRADALLHLEEATAIPMSIRMPMQKMAVEVLLNAKMRRVGICGATESPAH